VQDENQRSLLRGVSSTESPATNNTPGKLGIRSYVQLLTRYRLVTRNSSEASYNWVSPKQNTEPPYVAEGFFLVSCLLSGVLSHAGTPDPHAYPVTCKNHLVGS
jgi:hypothetical protein